MKISVGAKVEHPTFGEGVVFAENENKWRVFFQEHGEKELGKSYEGFTLLEAGAPAASIGLEDVVQAVEDVFDRRYSATELVEMADKWEKGNLVLQPADASLSSKEIPMETFFHKIVMVRDRLRVLEQNINSHKALSEKEKVDVQQYITRCYGSLTTFNVLFRNKEDHFVGEKKS
jgi:hypothetical protein